MRGQTNSAIKQIVGTSGLLENAVSSPESCVISLSEHSVTTESRAEKTVERYRVQFAAMESMVAQMDQVSGYLNQQLAIID